MPPRRRRDLAVPQKALRYDPDLVRIAPVPPARRIRVSGGVSRFDGLCRRLAAISGLPVHRRDDPEATARGIGYLAAGRPAQWNAAGAGEDVVAPVWDAALATRYRRWRLTMAEATGI